MAAFFHKSFVKSHLRTLIKTYTWSLWSEKNIGKINCIFDKFCQKLKGPCSTNVNFGLFGEAKMQFFINVVWLILSEQYKSYKNLNVKRR